MPINHNKISTNSGSENIQKVDSNATVISVLPLLYEKRLSAVAIVDDKGTLVGNFSVSDLRVKFPENSISYKFFF